MRAAYIVVSAIVAMCASYFGAHMVHRNTDAITVMITMFTVFAGFVVAIVVILGDPALLPAGSWRNAEAHRENIRRRLIRHQYLFWVYLLTIGFIFAATLFKEVGEETTLGKIGKAVEYLYFGIAVFAFLLTLALPQWVTDLQQARVDAEIERRKNLPGAGSLSGPNGE